jgi:hypothetical protein
MATIFPPGLQNLKFGAVCDYFTTVTGQAGTSPLPLGIVYLGLGIFYF